jgi:5-methylcytosine-specific restriction endonuclease McrA
MSRFPYPWNFKDISKAIIARDGGACQGPNCKGTDSRMTAHHIDYDKSNCDPMNLIALCSACNSSANFGRDQWRAHYQAMMASRFTCEAM